MGWYNVLHSKAEEFLASKIKDLGHEVALEQRKNTEVIFDVYDVTANEAWEVLTAKIVRSSHEKDEAIIEKIFRYLLWVEKLKFLIVSYNHEELEIFHKLEIEHWHLNSKSWTRPEFRNMFYHRGQSAKAIAIKIAKALLDFAPMKEWISKDRRKKHKKVPKELLELNKKLNLPNNFLKGVWRDWRLMWVWKFEKSFPRFVKKYASEIR